MMASTPVIVSVIIQLVRGGMVRGVKCAVQ